MEILIPTQDALHKQWCLFDQEDDKKDFGEVASGIPGNTLSFPFGLVTQEKSRSNDIPVKKDEDIKKGNTRILRKKRRI